MQIYSQLMQLRTKKVRRKSRMEILIALAVYGVCTVIGYILYRDLKVAMDAKRHFEENYK